MTWGQRYLVSFVVLVAITCVTNRYMIFEVAHYETGDHAANALQVNRALQFREIHGNYSRFGFNHPGPVFFYIYGWGEWLFHDMLAIVPTVRSAHLLASLLTQIGFFVLAVTLAAQQTVRPLVSIGFGVAIGSWHFAQVPGSFFSNWPPHVLLMPFVSLLVAAASVSLGQGPGLFALVLSGCVLVHGHIAQPLFVLPIAGIAIASMLINRRRSKLRLWVRDDWVATAIAFVFLVPILLDLASGGESNAYRVLSFFAQSEAPRPGLYASVLYLLSYFVYSADQSALNAMLYSGAVDDFSDRWLLLAFWLVVLCATMYAITKSTLGCDKSRLAFPRRLLILTLFTGLLSIVWGLLQSGGLTAFNGYFIHSISFVLLLTAVVGLGTRFRAGTGRLLPGLAITAGLVSAMLALRIDPEFDQLGLSVEKSLDSILRADPLPERIKYLDFGSTFGDWNEAVTVGRALERRRIPFVIHPRWEILFGKHYTVSLEEVARGDIRTSTWQLVSLQRNPDALGISPSKGVRFLSPHDLGMLPSSICFGTEGNDSNFPMWGVDRGYRVSNSVRTDAKIAVIEFLSPDQEFPVQIAIDAEPFVTNTRQTVQIRLNGVLLGTLQVSRRGLYKTNVPVSLWNSDRTKRLSLHFPEAASTRFTVGPGERQSLALLLHRLEFCVVPTLAADNVAH